MRKKLKPIYDKLVHIEVNILTAAELLGQLSQLNKEKTKDFTFNINKLDGFFREERKMLSQLDYDSLKELSEHVLPLSNKNQTFERLSKVLQDRIDFIDYSDDSLDDEDYEDEDDDDEEDAEEELKPSDYNLVDLDDYYLDYDEELDKKYDYTIAAIYIKALKNSLVTINNLYKFADNPNDRNFSVYVSKYFKAYKYYWFLYNNILEDLGIMYRFDIDSLPFLSEPNEDMEPVLFNECIDTIDFLIAGPNGNDVESTCIALVHIEIILALLDYLTPEHREAIVKLLDEYKAKMKIDKYATLYQACIKKKIREK